MDDRTMARLAVLCGSWSGRGSGNYPTIDRFDYEETTRFELDSSYPLIHYEQRTRLLPGREPSHWESGFIRVLDDGSIEISNSQESGRVEVLRGRLDEAESSPGKLRVALDSVVLDHDPRLHRTRRVLCVDGNRLTYEVHMATHTTPEPRLQKHLEAILEKS